MFQKSDILTILKINGVSPAADPAEIKQVLERASYSEAEIEAALSLLKTSTTNYYDKHTELNKVFRTTEALKPSEISALLGIEVQVACVDSPQSYDGKMNWWQSVVVTIFALTLAIAGILGAMYFYEVGMFHPTVSALGNNK